VTMSEAAVSIAMATYNGERFLQEQLDSVARQTLLPYELVACDDGSTDGTLDILHRFASEAPFPVRVFRNPSRLGYGFNFLGALSRCTGELVAFCDQDDVWMEQKLQVCADVMIDPGISLVSHSAVITSALPLRRRMRFPKRPFSVVRHWQDFPRDARAPGFSMVFRRDILNKVPLPRFDAEQARWATHDVWALAAALSCGHLVLLPDELVLYRLHAGNATFRAPQAGLYGLAPDPCGLESMVELSEGVAQFFLYAAAFCDEPARGTFHEYVLRLQRRGHAYRDRAQLHRACGRRFKAIRTLAGMIAKGDYGPRRLGAKALVRDLLLATVWQGFTRREPVEG
jgi:glycosyltransferase involved in cell wall biosynthesis